MLPGRSGARTLSATTLAYNLKSKRYEARPEMVCMLHIPQLEEAIRTFFGEAVPLPVRAKENSVSSKVDLFKPPVRKSGETVERRVFLAIDQGRKLKVHYCSLKSGERKWREIAPHALGQDGYRWHVRAWCFKNGEFRDFALSRILDVDWPGEIFQAPAKDEAWETFETIRLRPNSELSAGQREAIELDYGMIDGVFETSVRVAMKPYFLDHCRFPILGNDWKRLPMHLELVE